MTKLYLRQFIYLLSFIYKGLKLDLKNRGLWIIANQLYLTAIQTNKPNYAQLKYFIFKIKYI